MIVRKVATPPAAEVAAEVVKNATSAERSATLLVLAPSRLALEVRIPVVAMVVEISALSAVEKPGGTYHGFFSSALDLSDLFDSYSCGGVGHLSRDCVQGSKCYNCSGFVRTLLV